jgi:hypothetical protein
MSERLRGSGAPDDGGEEGVEGLRGGTAVAVDALFAVGVGGGAGTETEVGVTVGLERGGRGDAVTLARAAGVTTGLAGLRTTQAAITPAKTTTATTIGTARDRS